MQSLAVIKKTFNYNETYIKVWQQPLEPVLQLHRLNIAEMLIIINESYSYDWWMEL